MKNCLKKVLSLLITCLLLQGCWDSNEPERMLYIQGLGIDFKNGKYVIYLQISNLSLLAKSESSGSSTSDVKLEVGHATGKTFDTAIFNLYQSASRRLFWGHLSYMIFTERALNHEGILSVIDMLDRYRETRYRTWVYATKDSLEKIFVTTPTLNMSTDLSRLSDPKNTFKQSSTIRPINLRELIISIDESPHQVILPYISYFKRIWYTDRQSHPTIKMNGLTSASKKRLNGHISLNNAKGFRWIHNEFVRDVIQIKHDNVVVEKKDIEIKPIIKGSKYDFDINLKMNAVIYFIKGKKSINDLATETEKIVKKEVIDTYLQGLSNNTDIYRLSELLKRKNFNLWKKVEIDGKIPLSKDSIRKVVVKVKIINGGKQRHHPTL